MSNQKGFSKIAIIIIVLILISGAYFVFSKKDENISFLNTENQSDQLINDIMPTESNKTKLLATIPEEYGEIDDIFFSDDNNHFAYRAGKTENWFMVIDGKKSRNYDWVEYLEFLPNNKGFVYKASDIENKDFIVFNNKEIAVNSDSAEFLSGFPVVSPNGDQLAYLVYGKEGYVVVLNGNRSKYYKNISNMLFSFDGKNFAYKADILKNESEPSGEILVINGEESKIYDRILDFTFSPDGNSHVFIAKREGETILVVNGKEEESTDFDFVWDLAYSPNGKQIVYFGKKTGKEFFVLNGKKSKPYDDIQRFIFSPDSKNYAYSVKNEGNNFLIFNDQSKKFNYPINFLGFSVDGKLFFYSASTEDKISITIENLKENKVIFTSNPYKESCSDEIGGCRYGLSGGPFFSPDNKHFIFNVVNETKSFLVIDGKEGNMYDQISNTRFSIDSNYIIYNARIGRQIWRIVKKVEENNSLDNGDTYKNKQSSSTDLLNKINPKNYSLVEYPLKQSPIYSQLPEYCFDHGNESQTIQQDTHLVKNNNEVIIPSIRQLIFASRNEEPNCITIVKVFSAPQNGKYSYLEVSELSFKEHSSWPIYRLDLSDLSIKKLSIISSGGSITIEEGENFMGFLSSNNTLLSDGKKLVWWDERSVYLVNLETDFKSILYTAPQNQWLISGVDPEDVIGQFFNTDVQIDKNKNQVTIGVYDKIMSQDGKMIFDESGDINWLELEPKGERLIEHKFKLIGRVTISIPLDN